jgi:hypothetical protein
MAVPDLYCHECKCTFPQLGTIPSGIALDEMHLHNQGALRMNQAADTFRERARNFIRAEIRGSALRRLERYRV